MTMRRSGTFALVAGILGFVVDAIALATFTAQVLVISVGSYLRCWRCWIVGQICSGRDYSLAFLRSVLLLYVALSVIAFSSVMLVGLGLSAASIASVETSGVMLIFALEMAFILLFCLLYTRMLCRLVPHVSFNKKKTSLFDSIVLAFAVLPLLWFTAGGYVGFRLIGPLVFLLFYYIRFASPKSEFTSTDFVLFLRKFGSFADSSVVISLLGSVGKSTVAVSLPPEVRGGPWDPVTICLSGLKLLRPLTSIPLYFRFDDDNWVEEVRHLISGARCIVVDISEPSVALGEELALIVAENAVHKTIFLHDGRRSLDQAKSLLAAQGIDIEVVKSSLLEFHIGEAWGGLRTSICFVICLFCAAFAFAGGWASVIISAAITNYGEQVSFWFAIVAICCWCVGALIRFLYKRYWPQKKWLFCFLMVLFFLIINQAERWPVDWQNTIYHVLESKGFGWVATLTFAILIFRSLFNKPLMTWADRRRLRSMIGAVGEGAVPTGHQSVLWQRIE